MTTTDQGPSPHDVKIVSEILREGLQLMDSMRASNNELADCLDILSATTAFLLMHQRDMVDGIDPNLEAVVERHAHIISLIFEHIKVPPVHTH